MTVTPSDASLAERIGARLRVVPDFPSKGIQFQDVTPVLADAGLFTETIVGGSGPAVVGLPVFGVTASTVIAIP